MTNYNFPIKDLTPDQKLWLSEVYEDFKRGGSRDLRIIRSKLSDRISPDFNPISINNWLLDSTSGLTQSITLLGIWHVDPASQIFENCDKVIRAVRALLIKHFEKHELNPPQDALFTFVEVANQALLTIEDVQQVYSLLKTLHGYWQDALYKDPATGDYNGIKVSGLNPFNDYMRYAGIDKLYREIVEGPTIAQAEVSPDDELFEKCLDAFRTDFRPRRQELVDNLARTNQRNARDNPNVANPGVLRMKAQKDHLESLGKTFIEAYQNIVLKYCDTVNDSQLAKVKMELQNCFTGQLKHAQTSAARLATSQGRGKQPAYESSSLAALYAQAQQKYSFQLDSLTKQKNIEYEVSGRRVLKQPEQELDPVLKREGAPFVNRDRIGEIAAIHSPNFDAARLVQLCKELNACHAGGLYYAVAMICRAIVDHVPTVFACQTFSEVANNYGGSKSFRDQMAHLNDSLKPIAHAALHVQMRRRETLLNATQVDFSNEIDVLLQEVCRLLKKT